jgi:fluoride exporter
MDHEGSGKMNLQIIIAVAIGGAIGSVARYLVGIGSGRLFGLTFPWGTLIINVLGSFLIGVFVESFSLRWDLPLVMRVFLTVGICGGFTTFSTFSLDAGFLMQRGEPWPAAAYVIGSVTLSIAALFVGLRLIRTISWNALRSRLWYRPHPFTRTYAPCADEASLRFQFASSN